MALALLSSIVFGNRADAGLIITVDQSSEFQGADGSLTQPVQGDSSADKRLQHLLITEHETVPAGAGSAGAGWSAGLALFGALDVRFGPLPSPPLSAVLEECRLSVPDSPVFDRLRPPRSL